MSLTDIYALEHPDLDGYHFAFLAFLGAAVFLWVVRL